MPAHAKRPRPPERMVVLLAEQKRQLLETRQVLTVEDFEAAWDLCWTLMVTERAWPHATVERRGWRKAMLEAMKPEARACFVGSPTGFYRYVDALAEAMEHAVLADVDVVLGQLVA